MCKKEYINLQTGEVLDLDKAVTLKDNAMLKVKPELWEVWDFEKNNELRLDVWKVTKGSNKKVWWYCHKCAINYDMEIYRKTSDRCCPYCNGKRVNHTNSLASLNPKLASEWHPSKNGELTPYDVTCGSGKKVWWKCEKGHEWGSTIDNRHKGKDCPYCTGRKVLVGFNDMWTTNPELASLLANPEDGYKYMQSSNKKVDWKCSDCKSLIKNRYINSIKRVGLSCDRCSDGISIPEKIMYNLLKESNLEFTSQKLFSWSKGKRYDFYIQSNNTIIEVHGRQHYEESGRGRSLRDEIENDRLKRKLAIENGIEQYIVIDAKESDFEYIKNSIISSKIVGFLDFYKVKWEDVNLKSQRSILFKVSKLWEEGFSVNDIINELNLGRSTVFRYLNRAKELEICNYSKYTAYRRRKLNLNTIKKIVQLDDRYNVIKWWDNMNDAKRGLSLMSAGNICNCCKGNIKSAHGFKWMYKEDYDKYIEEQNSKLA